ELTMAHGPLSAAAADFASPNRPSASALLSTMNSTNAQSVPSGAAALGSRASRAQVLRFVVLLICWAMVPIQALSVIAFWIGSTGTVTALRCSVVPSSGE